MALSRRFGMIQSLGLTQEDDQTCEEYHLLQKLIGNNTLFPCPSSIPIVSNSGDNKDINLNSDSDEEERVNPLWRVEFQNILRKCKQRRNTIDIEELFTNNGRNGDDTNSQGYVEDKSCDQILEEQLILDQNKKHDDEEFSNAHKSIEDESNSSVKENVIVNDTNDTNVNGDDLKNIIEENEIYENTLISNKVSSEIQSNKGKLIGWDEKTDKEDANEKGFNKKYLNRVHSSESVKENVESYDKKQPTKPTRQVTGTDKTAPKDKKSKFSNDSIRVNKKTKPLVKVIPTTCFPLDELLPKATIADTKNQSKPLEIMDSTNVNVTENTNIENLYSYKSHLPSYMSPIQNDDSVFHGEVYGSPVIEHFEPFSVNRSDSIDYGTSFLTHPESTRSQLDVIQAVESDNRDGSTSRNASLENFSFIFNAIHEGNDFFVEQLQTVLSKQNKNWPNDQQNPSSNGGSSEANVNDNSLSSGSFHRYSVSGAENFIFNESKRDGQADTRPSSESDQEINLLTRKDENQSNQLFRLFVDQCSQLVKTDEDRKMLASLVKLLKRESGSELFSTTGFTPPATPSHQTTHDRITTPTCKNEAEVELFEGRTLLKGGVPPRHIPKTAIVKTGNDRPIDPRPISTMLSKPKAKPLPLPKFIYEMHDRSVIQRILTLDWDCKRSLFLEDNSEPHTASNSVSAYNPSKDLQNLSARSGDTHLFPVQAISTAKNDELQGVVFQDSVDKNTPLKDEARQKYHEIRRLSAETLSLDNSVYGRCNIQNKTKSFDGVLSLQTLKDKIGDLIQATCNKNVKRGLFGELNDSENQKCAKKNSDLQDKIELTSNEIEGKHSYKNKIPVINSESSNSYDFKSLVKTDSFLGSLDKLSHSTLPVYDRTSPPSDSNNNHDSDMFVEHTVLSDNDSSGLCKQKTSLKVHNVSSESIENQINSNTSVGQSIPVLLSSDKTYNIASEFIENTNNINESSSRSIPVHVSSASREADSSPRGVYNDNNIAVNKADNQTDESSRVFQSEVSGELREEGELTPDIEEVIVLSDDEDHDKKVISTLDANSKENPKSAFKATKESKLTKVSQDKSKPHTVKHLENRVKETIVNIIPKDSEISTNKVKTKSHVYMKGNKYVENESEDVKQESNIEAMEKSGKIKSSHNESTNRKRKIAATGARICYDDFDYQDGSDGSILMDGKRKKREVFEESVNLHHNAKPKHIRERKRHSSCSSVESIKIIDHRRESSKDRQRHKSTISSTRSSTEVRSSTPSSRSRSNSLDKTKHSSNQSHSHTDRAKHSRSLSHTTSDKTRHSSSQNHSNTDRLGHTRSLSLSSTDKSKHSRSLSNSNTDKSNNSKNKTNSRSDKSKHSCSQNHSRSESSVGHRKRHHTVHDDGQSTTEKRSRLETVGANISKRRHSDDHKISHINDLKITCANETNTNYVKRSRLLYDDILSPEYSRNTDSEKFSILTEKSKAEHTQVNSKPQDHEDILSPDNSGLSDELLSEEYHRLFGKKSDIDRTSAESNPYKPVQKSIFSKVLPNKVLNKSLEDDMKFLENYKQKVQKKETTTVAVVDTKPEKSLDSKQELEDRKFLQMCKKRMEEKAKHSFEQQMRAYKND